MSVHQVHICDLCGACYEPIERFFGALIVGNHIAVMRNIEFLSNVQHLDLCDDCMEALQEFLESRKQSQ